MAGKPISKQAMYSKIASHSDEIIDRLLELAKSSNDNVALGACKTLLGKALPDMKTVELDIGDMVEQGEMSDKDLMEYSERLKESLEILQAPD